MSITNIILLIIFVLIVIWAGKNIMNQPKTLSPEWQERLDNVEIFNQFAAENPVELSRIVINQKLDGLHIHNGNFNKVFWKYTSATNAIIENVIFEDGAFEKVDFTNTVFRNVTFKGYTIANTTFSDGQLDNVKFIDCQLIDNQLRNLKESSITMYKITANGIVFSGFSLNTNISKSDIRDSAFRKLVMPSSLEIEDSTFNRNDISGKLSHFKLINSTVDKSTFSGNIESDALIDGGKIKSFVMGAGANNMVIRNLFKGHIGFAGHHKVNSVLVENCKNMEGFGVGIDGHINKLHMKNVSSEKLSPLSATIEHFIIDDSEFNKWNFNDAKVDILELHNVPLDEEATFSGATIAQHNLKDLKTKPGLKLNLENSNITPHDLGQ